MEESNQQSAGSKQPESAGGSRATSQKVAKQASKILNDPNSTEAEKSVAASALAQTRDGSDGTAGVPPAPVSKPVDSTSRDDAATAGETPAVPQKLLRFKDGFTSPTLDLQIGEYRRSFKVEDQPFAVESQEVERMLLRTGHFVKATAETGPQAEEKAG